MRCDSAWVPPDGPACAVVVRLAVAPRPCVRARGHSLSVVALLALAQRRGPRLMRICVRPRWVLPVGSSRPTAPEGPVACHARASRRCSPRVTARTRLVCCCPSRDAHRALRLARRAPRSPVCLKLSQRRGCARLSFPKHVFPLLLRHLHCAAQWPSCLALLVSLPEPPPSRSSRRPSLPIFLKFVSGASIGFERRHYWSTGSSSPTGRQERHCAIAQERRCVIAGTVALAALSLERALLRCVFW